MAKKTQDKKTLINQLNKTTSNALKTFNANEGKGWTFGDNWNSALTPDFDVFINSYLFPKLDETTLINKELGNKFNWLVEDMDFIAQVQEEYVIKDVIPVNMNLSKNATLMFERNYPDMITKIYGPGELKKVKFTLNNNDVRLSFLTIKDAVSYAVGVYSKRISDINVEEERTLKSMLVDYSTNVMDTTKLIAREEDLINEIYNHLLYLQNNDHIFNESNKASNGAIGRYTTVSALNDLIILTDDDTKMKLLDTKIANTYNIAGLDITNHIISFRDLGGAYRITKDVTVTTEIKSFLVPFGDYQTEIGDIIFEGTVFTFDISSVIDDYEEIKPDYKGLYAFIIDINAIKFKRYTKDMLKTPFFNAEFDEWSYWLHYYSFKTISPFYNKAVIQFKASDLYINTFNTNVITLNLGDLLTQQDIVSLFLPKLYNKPLFDNDGTFEEIKSDINLFSLKNYDSIDFNTVGNYPVEFLYNGFELDENDNPSISIKAPTTTKDEILPTNEDELK